MNYGFWSTTPRQNVKFGSGTLQTLPVPRKREWANPKSRDRPQGICATRTNCQSNFLSGNPWKTQEKGGTFATRHCTHLNAAPRQRPVSHGSLHQWICGREKHSRGSSAPPYSLDLSHCDFFLFPWLKGHHFATFDNIQKRVTDELKGTPAEAFQHCYEQWKQRLRHCVAAQGNYSEEDNLDL